MRRSVVEYGFLLLSLAGAAAAQLPLGPEQQANSFTVGVQFLPRIAAAPDGRFLLGWVDRSDNTIRVRRFDEDGSPAGPEFQVDESGSAYGWRVPSSLLVDEDGEFTVVWGDVYDSPGCAFCTTGSARRMAADGTPLGAQFEVAAVHEYGFVPAAAGRPSGDFVVATKVASPIELTRYSPAGAALGQTVILAEPNHGHGSPHLAIAPTGEFVVAWNDWERTAQYPSEFLWDRILVQRFGATGDPAGSGIEVTAPESEGYRRYPKVARSASGSFLVVWEEDPTESGGVDATLLIARAYDAEGVPIGGPVQVSESTAGAQLGPTVAAAPDGTFVVAWTDLDGEGGGGDGSGGAVRARQLAATGNPASASFQINSFTTGYQRGPSLTLLPDGDLVVSWTSDGSFGNDDSEESIQVRRFRLAFFADGFESGDISRWSGGSG
jgi:hypothetical protein